MDPQMPVTLFHNSRERNKELIPQQKKKAVRSHLYFPIAYSLIMRQLGLNSGLTKCKINKQINEIEAEMIVIIDKILMIQSV